MAPRHRHVHELVEDHAQAAPERTALVHLARGEEATESCTYGALALRMRAIGRRLAAHAAPGDRVILLQKPGPEYVATFLGCLAAGVVPVPAYPPRAGGRDRAGRLDALLDRAAPRLAVADAELALPQALPVLDTREVDDQDGEGAPLHRAGDGETAFLQFTSGSTRAPRGVVITHANLAHNIACIRDCFRPRREDTSVTWLPPYHDMGLVGALLEPLTVGMEIVIMPPVAFLQRPVRWLRAMSAHRAVFSGGPDFAFALVARSLRDEELDGIDLTPWRVAWSGAEHVRAKTLTDFATRLARTGFRRESFVPCYGLAESTLMVTSVDPGAAPLEVAAGAAELEQGHLRPAGGGRTRTLVGCGVPRPGLEVIIVDPQRGRPAPAGEIGEIWVRGPSVSPGYFGDPEETAAAFDARIEDAGGYHRTGDLGCFAEGELVITGRLKDLIIIDGKNHAPEDVEAVVSESHPGFVPGAAAAFSVERRGREVVVVLQELRRDAVRSIDTAAAQLAAGRATGDVLGLAIDELVLVKPWTLLRTSSGKIRRGACREAFLRAELARVAGAKTLERSAAPTAGAIETTVRAALAKQLGVAEASLDDGVPFSALGLDSRGAVVFSGELERALGRELAPTICYEHPTIAELCAFLRGDPGRVRAEPGAPRGTAIAVIGAGCRFPGAGGPEAFLELLRAGRDAIRAEPPPGRPDRGAGPGGWLEDPSRFDAEQFGILPREAERMDPQQRLALEVAWEALEHAAIAPERLRGRAAGVFLGISGYDYSRLQDPDPYAGTGNALSIAANRISYCFDLRGPSTSVDTACSSSLVAVHLACRALAAGECELALAGGVNLMLDAAPAEILRAAGMLSPDGRCHTFDAAANGYVRGEGCGIVVLKPLERALADGDEVLAVIRGSAVNQDGRSNGLTAPSGRAQREVIEAAWKSAGVTAADVGYVEAHGTGTPLGDPIEVNTIAALAATRDSGAIAIGSVKTNVGHLEAAAGVAGLIKVILAVRHGELFPHLHLEAPNPALHLDRLVITREHARWDAERRIAGVSSFGFGGTNAHVVVEAPPPRSASSSSGPFVAALSARTAEELDAAASRWASWVERRDDAELPAIIETMCSGRAGERTRRAWVVHDRSELAATLRSSRPAVESRAPARIALLFTGQGAQHLGMGRGLYAANAEVRAAVDTCEELLLARAGFGVRALLLGDAEASEAERPSRAQPALLVLQHALTRALAASGVVADVVLGHSIGEYAAACAAGVMQLQDALTLLATRGLLTEREVPRGAMATLFASPDRARELLDGVAGVELAAINGPRVVTISGDAPAVARACERARSAGIHARLLDVSFAFHSAAMDAILQRFELAAGEIAYQPPALPYYSGVTGWRETELIATAAYWTRHVRAPVLFAPALERLQGELPLRAAVELGPRAVLAPLARATLPADTAILTLDASGADRWAETRAALWEAGVACALTSGATPRLAGAPGAPLRRTRYWHQAAERARKALTAGHPLLGRRVFVPELEGALFQSTVSLESDPELYDHRAYQSIVVAGASHVSLLLGAHRALHAAPGAIRDLAFPQGLIVAPGATRVTQLRAREHTFELSSFVEDAGKPAGRAVHAIGRFCPAPPELDAEPLDAVRARCPRHLGRDELYALAEAHQLQFGPTYRWNAEAWVGEREVLARLEPPAEVRDADRYELHPGLIDSSFQLAAATGFERGDEAFILARIGEYVMRRRPAAGETLWAHAVRHTESAEANVQRFDVRLFDGAGRTISEAREVELRRASIQGFMRVLSPRALDGLFHERRWEAAPPGETREGRRWLVFGSGDALEHALITELERTGRAVRWEGRAVDEDECERRLRALAAAGEPIGVLYAWPLEPAAERPTTAGVIEHQHRGAFGLLGVIRALLRAGLDPARVALRVLARDAAPDAPDSAPRPPVHAPMRGLLATYRAERPGADACLIDADDGAGAAELAAAVVTGGEPELALRGGRRFVPRLVARAQDFVTDTIQLDPSAAYVITGGTGAVAGELARWLASRGARRVVSIARRAPGPGARIHELERLGVRVTALQADVADAGALAAAWSRIDAPVRGVIHAAGVLGDGALESQTVERFVDAFAPKVAGTWNLHRLTEAEPLDFFLCCSSVASLFGSPGQASYAAANAFLDGFAAYRGRRTISVWWGPWAGAGMAAPHRAALEASGLRMIEPSVGAEVTEQILRFDRAQIGVFAADWPRFFALRDPPPLFARLREHTNVASRRRADLTGAPAAELERYLRAAIGETARMPADAVDPAVPLNRLGLDSLMAVTLQERLRAELGAELPLTRFMEDVTTTQLAAELEKAHGGCGGRDEAAPAPDMSPAVACSATPATARRPAPRGALDFSLFYFARSAESSGAYRLLREGARFADRNGLLALWLPERHFHEFGGLYPNPSVLAASLATTTTNVRLRAGSVVLPLHHPARVAEEWAVVDNLSGGRVDVSFVRGWGPRDFALAPDSFARRTEVLEEKLDQVRRLWRGESIVLADGRGQPAEIRVFPRPVQPELPVWLTCTADQERFASAGRLGANVLTALLLQSPQDLERNVAVYRRARLEHGHDPSAGRVTLMLHTFIGADDAGVRERVRAPLIRYLRSSVDLWRSGSVELDRMSEPEREQVLDYAFERYYRTSGLLGTPERCAETAARFHAIGVDELACLIDFGVDDSLTLEMLENIPRLRGLL